MPTTNTAINERFWLIDSAAWTELEDGWACLRTPGGEDLAAVCVLSFEVTVYLRGLLRFHVPIEQGYIVAQSMARDSLRILALGGRVVWPHRGALARKPLSSSAVESRCPSCEAEIPCSHVDEIVLARTGPTA